MELLKKQGQPSTRLNRGNMLMANSQQVDTQSVKARLDAFIDIHSQYIEAVAGVEEAEAAKRAEVNCMEMLDGGLHRAIAGLSAAMQMDGEWRRNPFGRFGAQGPHSIAAMWYGDEAKAMQDLVVSLRCATGVSKETLAAADRAEQAALKVAEAVPGLELRSAYLRQMRRKRDAMIPQWDAAYNSLRFLTKSVEEQPSLYPTLFPDPRKLKRAKPEAQATPEVASVPTQPANSSDPPKAA